MFLHLYKGYKHILSTYTKRMSDILSEQLLDDSYEDNNDKDKPTPNSCCDACYCDIFSWTIISTCCITCCNVTSQ